MLQFWLERPVWFILFANYMEDNMCCWVLGSLQILLTVFYVIRPKPAYGWQGLDTDKAGISWGVLNVTNTGPQPTSFGAKTLRDGHGAPTDEKMLVTIGGIYLTYRTQLEKVFIFRHIHFSLLTGGFNRPFRRLDSDLDLSFSTDPQSRSWLNSGEWITGEVMLH